MAKASSVAKNNRRKKMAAKGEAKRAELRGKIVNESLSDDESGYWRAARDVRTLMGS